jgi:hypothetical protein
VRERNISSALVAVNSPTPKSSPITVTALTAVVPVDEDSTAASKLEEGQKFAEFEEGHNFGGLEDVRRLAGLEEGHKFEPQLRVDVRKLARIEAGHKSAGQAASTLAGLEAGLVLA